MNPVRLLPKEMLRADASVPAHQQAHPSAAQIQPDSGKAVGHPQPHMQHSGTSLSHVALIISAH